MAARRSRTPSEPCGCSRRRARRRSTSPSPTSAPICCARRPGRTPLCEWKGRAHYFDLEVDGAASAAAAWHYPEPNEAYAELRDHIAFYAGRVDAAYLDDERVRPQGGGFYGGWVTDEIEGPFKGEPGTEGW